MQLKFKLTDTSTGTNMPLEGYGTPDYYLDLGDPSDGVITLKEDPRSYEGGLHSRRLFDSVTPRLFTGLHDAAGNEIYEGDVLQSLDPQFQPKSVIFDSGSFVLIYAGRPTYFGSRLSDENLSMKIIGNRWQPEFKEVFNNA